MASFPSKLPFAAFLQYSPRGTSTTSLQSKDVTLAIKRDGFLGGVRVIDFAARRIREERANYPFLSGYLNGSVTLVPAPRSSPQKDPRALWPALRISQSLKDEGCGGQILPCLKRIKPVTKSATAGSGQRPDPDMHYQSFEVDTQAGLRPPASITVVDDVITRGSTLLAMFQRLAEAFPHAQIRCFAVVRTMSGVEVDQIMSPVEGIVSFSGTHLLRQP
jgi:hypothetical protein